jgi:cell division protein ZapA
MAEVKISIGDREFEVACKEGEEHYLRSAASLLDTEAQALKEALGRIPESRMLLMAGLMLADKTANLEDDLKNRTVEPDTTLAKRAIRAETQLQHLQVELAGVKAMLAEAEATLAENANALASAETSRDATLEALEQMVGKVELVAADLNQAG